MSEASPNTEQIERELVALGEAPPSEAELALVRSHELDDDPDVASVSRLSELAEPIAFDDLSELETHRAWRSIEQRLSPGSEPAASKPSAGGGGSARTWLFAVAGLAAAAVLLVVLTPMLGGEPELAQTRAPSPEQVSQIGDQARSTLRLLDDGKSDTERAAELAADYQRRLEELGG